MMVGIAFAAAARDMAIGFVIMAGVLAVGFAIGFVVGRWLL